MTTEFFWRIDKSKWWEIKTIKLEEDWYFNWFSPFDEIVASKAPHIVINKPHYDRDPSAGVQHSDGKHILIPQEVVDLLLVWQLSPYFGGYNYCREFLDANY